MKAEKITERFPFTFPKIAAVNPVFPLWLLKKLLPKAEHWSGTTLRWLARRLTDVCRQHGGQML